MAKTNRFSGSQILRVAQKTADDAMKKQTQIGLAEMFTLLKCGGVAKEIKAGRNVSGNVAYGIKHCVHDKLGPTVNVDTWKFNPMTAKAKSMEKRMVELSNRLLKNAKFTPLPSDLISQLRKKDKAFEQKMKKRRAERKQ